MLARVFEPLRFLSQSAFAAPSRSAHRSPSRPAVPLPVSRLVRRPVSSRPRPARLPAYLPVPSLPVFLAVRSSPVALWQSSLRPSCRGAKRVAELFVAIRCVSHPLAGIRRILSACQARPANRVGRRGGRRGERALPMPSVRLCGFRVVKGICIYSFGKSPNM